MSVHRWLVLGLMLFSAACVGPSPARLPHHPDYMVVVSSVRLPEYMQWYTRFAHHSWIDIKEGEESAWTRIEVQGASSGVELTPIPADEARAAVRWKNPVSVLETLTGKTAQQACVRLRELAESEPDYGRRETVFLGDGISASKFHPARERAYRAWPGPNSNSFVASLLESTPGLHAELNHNAVGKDYPRGLRAGVTSSGWGFELDSSYWGIGVGLRQGLELHLLQLTVGLGFWPPAFKLPLLPRIGIHQGWVR